MTSAKFPVATLTLGDIGGEVVNFATLALSGNHIASPATITVTTTIPVTWPQPGYLTIDKEIFKYTSFAGSVFSGITSGADGTDAAPHQSQSVVGLRHIALRENQTTAEIIAIEKTIKGQFSIVKYGAVGDDSTDCSAAILAAIADAGSTGEVVIPPGTYRFGVGHSGTTGKIILKSLYKLRGAGRGISWLKYMGTGVAVQTDSILTDYPQIIGLTIINGNGGTIGLDIPNSRRGIYSDLAVQSFTTNYNLGAAPGIADYFNVFRSCQSYNSTTGFKLGNTSGANANFFDGCENFNDTNAIVVTVAAGCQFRNHHIEGATEALTITSGDNNEFDIYVEACTNAGTAASGTHYNQIKLYLDGSARFIDSGWNNVLEFNTNSDEIQHRATGEIYDKRDTGNFTAATKTLFSLTIPYSGAFKVIVSESGVVTSVNNYTEIGEWNITNIAAGGPTVTLVTRNGSTQLTTGVAGQVVTFSIAGHAAFAARYQYSVHIVGVGADASGILSYPTYARL